MEEMEMPTLCTHCGEWFNLNDGRASEKWHLNIIICKKCHKKEAYEIGVYELIEELSEDLDRESDELEIKVIKEKISMLEFEIL